MGLDTNDDWIVRRTGIRERRIADAAESTSDLGYQAAARALEAAGLTARCERETTAFQFVNFQDAWDVLAGVTTAALEPDIQERAKSAVCEIMWSDVGSPREFRNATQFITATKPALG